MPVYTGWIPHWLAPGEPGVYLPGMPPSPKDGRDPAVPIRFTVEDLRLIRRLQKKTGIVSRAEVIRRGLRALAEKESLK